MYSGIIIAGTLLIVTIAACVMDMTALYTQYKQNKEFIKKGGF